MLGRTPSLGAPLAWPRNVTQITQRKQQVITS